MIASPHGWILRRSHPPCRAVGTPYLMTTEAQVTVSHSHKGFYYYYYSWISSSSSNHQSRLVSGLRSTWNPKEKKGVVVLLGYLPFANGGSVGGHWQTSLSAIVRSVGAIRPHRHHIIRCLADIWLRHRVVLSGDVCVRSISTCFFVGGTCFGKLMSIPNEDNGGGWLMDYGLLDDFPAADYIWSPQFLHDPAASSSAILLGLEVEVLQDKEDAPLEKRARVESSAAPRAKACREKLRRDRLNDRFRELCRVLDPGKPPPPKADKLAVLRDATRLLIQLRVEAKKLKESNEALQDAIKNLKAEKSELRDEKTRLRCEKEQMEQMLRGIGFTPPPFTGQSAAATNDKTFAYMPPICMWQWVPPAALDTSQDHVLRPPVA